MSEITSISVIDDQALKRKNFDFIIVYSGESSNEVISAKLIVIHSVVSINARQKSDHFWLLAFIDFTMIIFSH